MEKLQRPGNEKVSSDMQTLRFAENSMLMPFVMLLVLSTLFSCLPQMGGKMSLEEFNREVNILQDSIMKQQKSNSETYLLISNIQSNQVSSNEIDDIKGKVYLIKERSLELMFFTRDVMINIIELTENTDTVISEGKEINFAELRRIDITGISHGILIGDSDGIGKARIVRLLLEEYKAYASDVLKDDASALEKLDKTIDIRQTIMGKENKPMTWENYYFAKKSEGEALIELLKIQASVKQAETIAITYLYNTLKE